MSMLSYNRPWLGLYSTLLTEVSTSSETDQDQQQPDVNHDTTTEQSPEQVPHKPPQFDISLLPQEVVYRIFSKLDPEGLTTASQVCRSWLIQAYEPSHWRRCAIQVWPHERFGNLTTYMIKYGGWRRLVIQRPRVLTSGIYVMRHLFVKRGTELPGMPVRPVLNVVYYRFLRFYNDGVVVGLTTPDNPADVYRRLKRNWTPSHAEMEKASPAIGRYEFDETSGVVTVQLPMFQQKYPDMKAGTMYFQIMLRESRQWAKNILCVMSHWAIMAGEEDSDQGQFVSYDSSQYMHRPFRYIPLVGFKRRVLEMYPPVEDWFDRLDRLQKS